MTMPRDEAVRTIEHAATVLAGDGEPTIAANLITASTTLAQHISQQDATIARLTDAAKNALPFMATQAVGCHGDKCREQWCYSCYGEEDADEAAQRGTDAYHALHAALTQEQVK